jgi:hypothetical protein
MQRSVVERLDAPLRVAAWLGGSILAVYAIALPLWEAHTPMMVDMPFHTSTAAILEHYSDPEWHVREQFIVRPFQVPYLSFYALIMAFMPVFPPLVATRIAIAMMLFLLPVGLAILAWGMRKSPMLGLLGLLPAWAVLTHWGFINHLGALGMFAAALGFALRLVDRPAAWLQWALGLTLSAILFTHLFRFPFAWLASLGAALCMWPDRSHLRAFRWPLGVPLALFILWLVVRPPSVGISLALHWPGIERLGTIEKYLYDAFKGSEGVVLYRRALLILGAGFAVVGVLPAARQRAGGSESSVFAKRAQLLVATCALGYFTAYMIFPMWIGNWFYVYPREITSAALVALALVPSIPRHGGWRLGFVLLLAVSIVPISRHVAAAHVEFAETTDGMWRLSEKLPHAPRLFYLILQHKGARNNETPYVHLPAYLQAEHGGWLGWHFAHLGASPLRYRDPEEPGAVVPPGPEAPWIWHPKQFDVSTHGAFFDWFIVRSRREPTRYFRDDPSIVRVAKDGMWWLYKREAIAAEPINAR